jgi:formylglycine-generating enzyme required for sulfatase activity
MLLDLGNNVTMRLVWVPAGAFTMGSSADEAGHEENEGPQHEVTISRPFLIGACEVTQEQYEAVMGSNPSKYPGHGMPVENVSWDDAMEFCARVSRKTGRRVTLPTEAQWEYACRAGTRTRYSFGDDQDQIKRYARQGEAQEAGPAPVGSHEPNPWGLYDMYGNVWEWCADWYAPYNAGAVTDPAGPASGQGRVVRGGRWHGKAADCRSAKRSWHASDYPRGIVGFRVVLATDEAEGESSTRSSVTSPGEARVSDDP